MWMFFSWFIIVSYYLHSTKCEWPTNFVNVAHLPFVWMGSIPFCKTLDSPLPSLGLQTHGSLILPLPNPYISMDFIFGIYPYSIDIWKLINTPPKYFILNILPLQMWQSFA
jgi:hypothetical protein